jgi:hypothetical protein
MEHPRISENKFIIIIIIIIVMILLLYYFYYRHLFDCSGHGPVLGCSDHGNESLGFIKDGKFL